MSNSDPSEFKQKILNKCMNDLFNTQRSHLRKQSFELVKRNDFLMNSDGHAYILDGEVVSYGKYAQNYVSDCASDLEDETRIYMKRNKDYEIEYSLIKAMLFRCLNTSDVYEDLIQLFPTQLIKHIPINNIDTGILTKKEILFLNKRNFFAKEIIAKIYVRKLLIGE